MPSQTKNFNQNSDQNKNQPPKKELFSIMTVKTLLAVLLSLGIGMIVGMIFIYGWNFIADIDKEKCEKSGGKWDARLFNCPGCGKEYFCDCIISYKTNRDGENSKHSNKFKLEENGFCSACQQDSDCGENKCEIFGNQCQRETAFCAEGICYKENYTYGSYDGDGIYNCVNNECQILNNESDTSNWQTYRNEEYGFEFDYPMLGSNDKEIFIKEKNNWIQVCLKPYGDNDWCHSLIYYEKPKEETIESSIKRQILDEDEQVICTIEKASFGLENRFTGCYIDCPSIGPSGFAYNHYVIDSNHPELFFMYSTGHDMIFDIDKWINSIRFIEN